MRFKHIKRGISLLLVLAMVFSMLPMQAHADETAHDHTVHAEASAEAELSVYLQLQHEADGLLKEHLLTLSMSPEQIRPAVDTMPEGSLAAARAGIEAMLDRFRQLSEEELLRFEEENPAFAAFSGEVMAHDTALEPMATSGTVLGGQITGLQGQRLRRYRHRHGHGLRRSYLRKDRQQYRHRHQHLRLHGCGQL